MSDDALFSCRFVVPVFWYGFSAPISGIVRVSFALFLTHYQRVTDGHAAHIYIAHMHNRRVTKKLLISLLAFFIAIEIVSIIILTL